MKWMFIFILSLTLLLILNIFLFEGRPSQQIAGQVTALVPREKTIEPIVYFCPRENCGSILSSIIDKATSYVHCAFFDIDLKDVIDPLAEKSRIADVKLVIDNENDKGHVKGNVKADTGRQFSHNKFCVIDDYLVLTGSFNPTENDNSKNNNNIVIFSSRNLAGNYEAEFQELWNGEFGQGEKVKNPVVFLNDIEIENFFCPEDGCESRIIEEIRKAESSIYFMTFTFTSEPIADALLASKVKDIKGVFEKKDAAGRYSQYQRLNGFGLDVKTDINRYTMHHKVFIIDNRTVITGSMNPTSAGNYKNDENIVIIHDKGIAGKFLKEFGLVWARLPN